ncbi:MAG: discoidin domain-containing protein, partial [Clostridia bacterium]|nr:discoidin domain-containing protein [Clostridia bacterium]
TLIDDQTGNETLTNEEYCTPDDETRLFAPYIIEFEAETEAYRYFKLDVDAAAGITNDEDTEGESMSIAVLSGIDLLGYSENYVYEENSYYIPNPHRTYGIVVEGSYDGVGWEVLAEFGDRYFAAEYGLIPTDELTEAASEYTFKYFRIRNPEAVHMEVAELEFFGITNDELPTYPEKEAWVKGVDYVVVEEVAPDEMADAFGSEYPGSVNWGFPEVTSGELLSGTIIAGYNGEQHCWVNDENGEAYDNASRVFDGNIDTFFDPFEASTASWAGLMLDDTYELTEVRIIPREDWYDRFAGIAVQGSNDGVTWDTIVWFTGDEAPAGWEYHCFTPETNEEYVNIYAEAWGLENLDLSEHWIGGGAYQIYRCVNLGGMHGNFAEIELYGNYVDTNTCEHELTYVEAAAKTCTADGNVEHWHCGLCGRNFADEAAAKRLIKVTIPASHTLTGIWETNETEHWQRCRVCTEKVEDTIGVHCYSVNCTAVINCDVCALTLSTGGRTTWEEGLDYVVMDDILTDDEKGELYGENYPASSLAYGWGEVTEGELLKGTVITGYNGIQHNWIHEDGSNPDNGNTAFDGNVHTCFDPFAAETNSWVGMIMEEGYQLTEVRIMPREGWLERMVGGAVQGSNDGINWVNIVYLTGVYECPAGFDFHCFTPETNTEYTAKYDAMGVAEPDMSTYWVNNGAYKYFRYVNLEGIHGNVGEIELYGEVYEGEHQHILTEVAEKAETCTTDGNSTYWHCESCGLNYTDETAETAIDDVVKKASGHNIALVEANPASCTATGNIKHYKCSACGVRFTDEAGTAVAENTTIPATGHDWGDGWIITTKPTTENVGKATRTCVNCNLSENKDVAAVTVAVTNEATTDATEEKNQVSVNVIGDESEAVVVIDEESLSTTLDTLGAGSGESANTTAASGNITIDVGSAVDETTEIKQVTIPTGAITDVAAAAASNDNATTGLEVKLSTGSVVFDATALNAIAAVANESEASNIELKIEKIATDDTTSVAAAASETMTTDAQKDTLDAMESDEAVQLLDAVDLTAGDVHELGSEAIISIPFDADGVDTDGLKITYIHVDGTVEEITPEYADGYLIFKVSHFSVYFIAWSEPVYTLSGTVTSYGLDSTAFGVELILNTPANSDADTMSTIEPVTLKGNKAVFTFENLVKGEYTLIINKKNHFVEKISVTIGGDTVEDIELTHIGHIVGKDEDDTTKDLTVDDLRIMNEYFAGISNNLPENIADLADVDGDDQFTRKDLMIMTRLLNGWNYTLKQ